MILIGKIFSNITIIVIIMNITIENPCWTKFSVMSFRKKLSQRNIEVSAVELQKGDIW